MVKADPQWSELAQQEMLRLREVLSGHIVDIQHFGGTAVPGLDAKPTLDLLLGTGSWPWPQAADAALLTLGFSFYKSPNSRWRVYLKRRGELQRGYHLHVVEAGSDHWHSHLRFRDHLRRAPEDAKRYAALKRELAQQFADDRGAYQAGKAELVGAMLAITLTT